MPYKDSHGHLDASLDAEQIATWFTLDHTDAVVGMHAGKSELIFLDMDIRDTTNGYNALGFLTIPDTFNYSTQSGGGKHYWYELSDSKSLPPQNKYRKMTGVDRKSGSSYVICWGEPPESREQFASPPEWLLDYVDNDNAVSGYNGDVDGWLDSIPHGEPTETVRGIIDTLPVDNFGHQDVLSITYRLVRLAAEGHTGVDWAIDQVFATWVKPPYDGPEHRKELANAIYGAIRKAGDEDISLKNLPEYAEVIDKVSGPLLDRLIGAPSGKKNYFANIKLAIREGLEAEDIASLIWNAPATMQYARDWGIEYLRQNIATFSAEALYEAGEGISPAENEDAGIHVDSQVSIITDAERKSVAHIKHFVKRYCEMAGDRVPKQNLPYDNLNGWTLLSCATSTAGFIPRKNGKEGLNSFGMIIGDTTSGKSAARKFLLSSLREFFSKDPGFNIGGNPSPSALGKKLLERDGQVSFFNKDEAHGALKTWLTQDWQSGLLEALADLYDGRVDPQLRTGDWENSGKSAKTHFIMHLQGTPEKIIELLNRDLFLSGFLARFIWAIGWPSEVDYNSLAEDDNENDEEAMGFDPLSRQIAQELQLSNARVFRYHANAAAPIRMTSRAAKRLQDAKWFLIKHFEGDPNYDILKPSLIRLGVMARKAASQLVISEGRTIITLPDILCALEQTEQWVANLVEIARQITASEFQRFCDNVENFINSRPDRQARREQVIRHFKAIETFKLETYISSLIQQGRVREFNGDAGAKYLTTEPKE